MINIHSKLAIGIKMWRNKKYFNYYINHYIGRLYATSTINIDTNIIIG